MLKNKGFSLLEVLLVTTIAAMIFFVAIPYSLNFYRAQLVEDTRANIIDALQRARHNAILQKEDSDFGVTLSEVANSYIIFQGSSYNTRIAVQDEVFPVVDSIILGGLADVIFSKLTGLPNATGTITLTYGIISKGIFVNDFGIASKSN